LAGAVADYEAEFGEITDEEMATVKRADRETVAQALGGIDVRPLDLK
jgi:hypothetical protein